MSCASLEVNLESMAIMTVVSVILQKIGHEIDRVQAFYQKAYTTFWDEVSELSMSLDFLGRESWENADLHELRHFLGIFSYCRASLQKLQWYGTVNAYGFRRLLQKLSYVRPNHTKSIKFEDIESKLSTAQFSSRISLEHDFQCVKRSITSIVGIMSEASPVSARSLILDQFSSLCDFPRKFSDLVYEAIRKDDVVSLNQFIKDNIENSATNNGRKHMILLVLIQLSIIYGSKGCVGRLLLFMDSIVEGDFTAQDYCPLVITRILVEMGHRNMIADSKGQQPTDAHFLGDSASVDQMLPLLGDILAGLGTNAQAVLLMEDPSFKRIPLHYAAQFGLQAACQLLLRYMQGAKTKDGVSCSVAVTGQDLLGSSPLRLAMNCGYDEVSRLLLEAISREQHPRNEEWAASSGVLLADAVKSIPQLLNNLLTAQANVNYQNPQGETALYIAARSGDEELVKSLLSHKANVALAEKAHGWTPLFIASVEGHVGVVELLMPAGAFQEDRDFLGWTALDHAAFRGHIKLAMKLKEFPVTSHTTSDDLPRGAAVSRPAKAMRMPLCESLILLNLNSFHFYQDRTAVSISPGISTDTPTLESQSRFSIEICLIGCQGPSHIVDLPILEDMVNKPWTFYTKDPDNAKIMFKIHNKVVGAHNHAKPVHIGSGIALLNGLKQGLGSTRESLSKEYDIPILAKDGLGHTGTATFSFVLVKPYLQAEPWTSATDGFWGNSAETKIVGHRGIYLVREYLYQLMISKDLVRILDNQSICQLERTQSR